LWGQPAEGTQRVRKKGERFQGVERLWGAKMTKVGSKRARVSGHGGGKKKTIIKVNKSVGEEKRSGLSVEGGPIEGLPMGLPSRGKFPVKEGPPK